MEASVSRPSLPVSSASSVSSVIYTESDADYFSDDLCESVVYSPTQASYPSFHLPSSPRRLGDSTPSLRTSTSLSSLSTTPSLSRASSFRRSPPLSPTTLATPTDFAPLSPQSQFLDVIEEAQSPEEEPSPNPFYSDERASASLPVLEPPLGFLTHNGTPVRSRVDSRLTITHQDSLASSGTLVTASPRVETPGRSAQSPKSHRIGGRTLSRLFGGKDSKKKQAKDADAESGISNWNGSAINLSLAKAEEKKRKRLAEKERMTELALDKLRGMLDMHIHDRTDQWDHGGYPTVQD